MRKVIHKWFWVWDFDKEEKWLNEMAAKGLALVGTGFCRYEFEECEPGEYQVRLELLENHPDSAEGQKYIQFLEETGAEHVGNYIRWTYFRKKAEEGQFDLFSDFDSRIRHLNRIQAMLIPVGLLNLCVFLNNVRHEGWLDWLSYVNLFCVLVLVYAWRRLQRKKKRLEREREISEN